MNRILMAIMTFSCVLVSSNLFAQCVDESHSPFQNQGWKSCQTSTSPASSNGKTHWIMYDLGVEKEVTDLRVWNHNVWGETGYGARTISVSYSMDKVNWLNAGQYDIPEAPGSWKYIAPDPIYLDDLLARYVLINILETWDGIGDCAGISEVKLSFGNVTSTDDKAIAEEFKVYPNPAYSNLNLEIPDGLNAELITVTNNLGQIIVNIHPSGATIQKIPILELEEGMYHLSVTSNNKIFTKSFVKMDY